MIIDTPITSANGYSPGTGINTGKAAITWTDLSAYLNDASFSGGGYQLRYRKSLYHYTAIGWQPGNYDTGDTSDRIEATSDTITTLSRDSIYAVQLIYIYAVQLIYTKNDYQVFAAREAFVWTSGTTIGSNYIASFVLNGSRLLSKTQAGKYAYVYYVCEDTFPSTDWTAQINHAFKQWEHALPDLIRMIHAIDSDGNSLPCAGAKPFIDEAVRRLQPHVDAGVSDDDLKGHLSALRESFKERGIGGKTSDDLIADDRLISEVLMIQDGAWNNRDRIAEAFMMEAPLPDEPSDIRSIATDIGISICKRGCAALGKYTRIVDGVETNVYEADIFLRESYHKDRVARCFKPLAWRGYYSIHARERHQIIMCRIVR